MGRPSNDEKIINDNPGLSPYELLAKGLSEKRYAEMIKEPAKVEVKEQVKIKPVVQVATPKLVQVGYPIVENDQVNVKMADGTIHPFTMVAAQKILRKVKGSQIV